MGKKVYQSVPDSESVVCDVADSYSNEKIDVDKLKPAMKTKMSTRGEIFGLCDVKLTDTDLIHIDIVVP